MENAGGVEWGSKGECLEDLKFHIGILIPCVTLDMSPDLFESQFSHLKHGNKSASLADVRTEHSTEAGATTRMYVFDRHLLSAYCMLATEADLGFNGEG